MSDCELHLHFSGDESPMLMRTLFKHPEKEDCPCKIEQGVDARALSILLVSCALEGISWHDRLPPPIFMPQVQSEQAQIDRVITAVLKERFSRPPKWMLEIFRPPNQTQMDEWWNDFISSLVSFSDTRSPQIKITWINEKLKVKKLFVYWKDHDHPIDERRIKELLEKLHATWKGGQLVSCNHSESFSSDFISVSIERESQHLLSMCAQNHYPARVKDGNADPYHRLGGAKRKMYQVALEMAEGPAGQPNRFFASVAERERVTIEHERYGKFPLARVKFPGEWVVHSPQGKSALAFEVPEGEEPHRLLDLLPEWGRRQEGWPKVCEAIKRTLHDMGTFQSTFHAANWRQDYDDYLRWQDTEPLVKELSAKQVEVPSGRWASPQQLMHRLVQPSAVSSVPVRWRVVHGDFHQRNIILLDRGQKFALYLIDFCWSQPRHWPIDYVVLESSLKLFHFGHLIPEDRYVELHRSFDDGVPAFSTMTTMEQCLFDAVRMIRREAQAEAKDAGNSWLSEYKMSCFLVTLGMLPVAKDVWKTWLTAGMFAHDVEQSGYLGNSASATGASASGARSSANRHMPESRG